MKCNRCLNKNVFLFEKIYCENCIDCYYCLKCAHISIFKICNHTLDNLTFTNETIDYKLKYKLTINQLKLSQSVINNIKNRNIFINATCGAGKTEILFEVIKQYVNFNKKVCFVTPRIEVTHELYHRFNRAFRCNFGIITGNKKVYTGPLFFMTCNQLVNYHNIFDLVIVDEADAFPLANDQILNNGIQNSLSNDGRVIKMSATPLKIDKNYLTLELFERYHKQKIPEPIFIKTSLHLLKEKILNKSWIVFFPTIRNLEEIYSEMKNESIIICHSKITRNIEKHNLTNETFVIFSTAILERGVTFANVNVIVYNSDHKNYLTSTLIQISGRVGRVIPYTNGEVLFMANTKTVTILRAIKYIQSLND
ncbi:MAG: DEAD/DEAH box helicase family protein [Bacilli bacterium]